MLIYSIMPMDVIFPNTIPTRTIKQIKGGFVETDSNNRIQRVISTDLKLYTRHNIGDAVDFK